MRVVQISTAIKLFSTNFPRHVYLYVATSYHYRKKSCRKEARSQGCLNPRGHLSSWPWLATILSSSFFSRALQSPKPFVGLFNNSWWMYLGLPRFQFALAEVRGSLGSRDILVSSSLASDPSEIKTINPWRSHGLPRRCDFKIDSDFLMELANFKFDPFDNRYFADDDLIKRRSEKDF